MTNGTPKTLLEAINNGLEASEGTGLERKLVIKQHLRDYLAQKFTAGMMGSWDLEQLWREVANEDI